MGYQVCNHPMSPVQRIVCVAFLQAFGQDIFCGVDYRVIAEARQHTK